MADTRTPEQRRRIMTAVRSKNTAPELRLRRALFQAGVRGWRCHYKRAPGKPDLAWPGLRVALFVDANTLVYHFTAHVVFGAACTQLLQRIENQELVGFTSTAVLGEAMHRLMTTEASSRFNSGEKGDIHHFKAK